ncbi:MAG: MFS transporter [Negativicutes bacterium]|nr:MFS transporter [Negativicutes bacterium]MDR3592830.1 MFS transporter [Negativicutes bacterium]
MPDAKTGRLIALAYFILLSIGVTFSLAGVVTKDIAGDFGVDTYVIGYRFTLFSIGYSLAVLGNGFVVDRVNVRKEALAAACLAIFAILGAAYFDTLMAFSLFIFIYGVGMGVLLSVAYYLVMNLSDEETRATRVSLLNFFFSLGAIVAPLLAGLALGQGLGWRIVYLATLVLLVTVVAVVWVLPLNVKTRKAAKTKDAENGWNAKVYIMGAALFAYVLSEMIFTYWIVLYMLEKLGLPVEAASASLSVFWVFMAVGRFLSGVFISRFNLAGFITTCAALAFAAFVALLSVQNPYLAMALIGVMGLGYSGLYATILSYGTLQVPRPSTRLTTFFLTLSTSSGILSFVLSSYLRASFDVTVVLMMSAALMAVVTLLSAFSGVRR